ncbi:MAG: CHAT domain-containing protein [Pyrinomonadaceae bacterium]
MILRLINFTVALVTRPRYVMAFVVTVIASLALTSNAHAWTQNAPAQTVAESVFILADGKHPLNATETHAYQVQLRAGQFLYALVEQQGIDISLAMYAPDNSQIATTDSPNDKWGTEPVLLLAEQGGNYRVEVRAPKSKVDSGSYRITIRALRDATEADKKHVLAERIFEEAQKLRSQPAAQAKRAAIQKYEEASSLFETVGDTYRKTLAVQMSGLAHAQLNEFRTAFPLFQTALQLATTVADQRLEGSIETLLGGASDVLGDISSAHQHYNRALELARITNNLPLEGSALNNIGKLFNDAGDFQNALGNYLLALPLFKDLPARQAITLNNIGVAYIALGAPDKALEYFHQSLPLLQVAADKNAESYTLSNMGSAYRLLANYEQAMHYYGDARAIQQKTGNHAQEAETLDLLGLTYSELQQPEKALEYHQQALQIQRDTHNIRREALSLSNLGHVYTSLNQPAKAIEKFDESLSLFGTVGDLSNTAVALEGRARAESQAGNIPEARKNIEQSLALVEGVRARSGSQQMRAAYLASREEAYEFYVNLLMQQPKEAGKDYVAEALEASERSRARSLAELLNESHVDIREGINRDLVTKERQIRESLNAKAQRQIQITAQRGSQQEIETLNKEISGLEDEYQQLQVAIRKQSPAYAALTQPPPMTVSDIQQQLDPNTILLEYSLGAERSYLWAVTQNSLKAYVLPRRAEIQKVAQQFYEALTARSVVKALESQAQRQTRITEGDVQLKELATRLGEMILAPAAGDLDAKRIVVIPDGALQYVPFSALPVPLVLNAVQRTSRDGKRSSYWPLILDHEVVSLPSASALAVQRQSFADRKSAPRAVAVIADPVFSTADPRFDPGARTTQVRGQTNVPASDTRMLEHLADSANGQWIIRRLPFTRQEAEQILAVAPAGSSLRALDFRANRRVVTNGELSKYRYVHFATHGYLDSTRANLSAIVLSLVDEQGRPQDGFLRTLDIYNLKLPAELVVLSACETGLGKEIRGEGLDGLTRGFMYAGARRVVVSLWNVNDKATADLMARFYRGMLREKKTPAAALRAAQMELIRNKQWQSPYYWAGFIMQGEWR